jgi:hypothetical protein
VRLKGLEIEKFRDRPACSIVPQPTTLINWHAFTKVVYFTMLSTADATQDGNVG